MSEELLRKLLKGQLDEAALANWLRQDEVHDIKYDHIICEPQEFAVQFTDYLRDVSARYVQTVPDNAFKRDLLPVNNILHTSTPKRKSNRSLPINDASFNDSNHRFKQNKHQRSFHNNTCPTLENFITENFIQKSKENLSLNQKAKQKKRNNRSNISPTLQEGNTLLNSNNNESESEVSNKSLEYKFNKSLELKNNNSFEQKLTEKQNNKVIDQKNDRSNIEIRRISIGKNAEITNNIKSRRIKPTVLSDQSQKHTIVSSNSFSFLQTNSEIDNDISSWQRSILKEEKEKIAARTSDSMITVRRNPTKKMISVTINQVTQQDKLDSLVFIYKTLIDQGYILSLATEIHFILTLLLANGQEGVFYSENDFTDIFDSIHNCVYFAAKVLMSQILFLQILNRSTLRLIVDNKRIQEFVPDLSKVLSNFITERPTAMSLNVIQTEDLQVATYIPETDSRDNFPTDASFHAFRRQRDLFYEIHRSWQSCKGRPGWNFNVSLGPKVRALLSSHQNPANYHHLSQLVTKQIMASSSYDEEFDNSGNIDKDLPNVSSEKLNKLKNRLVTREIDFEQTIFPNRQEFYREFITCAAYINSIFISHLINSFSDTLLTMEDGFDAERPDFTESTFMDNNYISFLKSSRLLSKFLGYIVSLPYNGDFQNGTLKTLLNVRKHCQPPIDIESRLKTSLTSGKILITVPWLIEFLINLDSVSLRLPSYESVIRLLLTINNALRGKFTPAAYFLRLCFGRLFQYECFPRVMFYEHLNSCNKNNLTFVDNIGDVAEEAFYECVPSLAALKKILNSGQASVCVRSIRPVTTTVVSGLKAESERKQLQLQEIFFHGQPESVRRSVNFVSERISSAIVKAFKVTHIESSLQDALDCFLKYLNYNHEMKYKSYEIYVKEAMQKAKDISENALSDLKSKCCNDAKILAKQRAERAIPSLLPEDIHPQVVAVCITVASNKAVVRITLWTEQTFKIAQFMDPLTKELGKMEEEPKIKTHMYITQYEILKENSIVKLLSDNKELIVNVYETADKLSRDEILEVLIYTRNTLIVRKDINAPLKDTIKAQVIDMTIALIINRADLSSEYIPIVIDCLNELCNVSENKKQKRPKDKTINILNARNVLLIDDSMEVQKSWLAFCNLVVLLLDRNILSPAQFEEQVLKVFQSDFSEETFKMLACCLRTIINDGGLANSDIIKVASCLTAYLVEDL